MPKEKYCIDCNSYIPVKDDLPKCASSKYKDLVSGTEKRTCMIERIDGIGRCGSLANNFVPKGEAREKATPRGVPEDASSVPAAKKVTKKKASKKSDG